MDLNQNTVTKLFSTVADARQRPGWLRYVVAIACVVAAWAIREGLISALGPTRLPFLTFFPAIAAAAWFGGLGPALVSLFLSVATANWFFIEPRYAFSIGGWYDVTALGGFVIAASFIITAIEAMHRTRRQLARAHQLLATTLSSIGDGVMVADAEGRIAFFNPEAERLTGHKRAEAEGRALTDVFRIVNEETGKPVENPVEKVLRQGTVVGLANHTVLLTADGRKRPIDDSAAPIREAGQQLFGVVLVFRDASQQRAAHLARAHLASIVESSVDAIFTKDLEGVIQSWNASAERLFGYRPDEVIGKPITIIIPPDRLHEEPEILARLRAGQPSERLETIRVTKDGRRIPVRISVSPLRDREGHVVGASKIIHDVSDIVAAREALALEKELLATTLASIGDAVIVTDVSGHVTFINSEGERLTGWTHVDAQGSELPQVFRIINEHTRVQVENPVEKVFRMGTVVGLANHTVLIAKDGKEVPIEDSAAPIRKPGGALHGVVLVFRDASERRLTEQVLKEADRRKDEFLAILSHELRNPLAPIRMAVAMLSKSTASEAELQELRDIIDRQTAQLARLLDDLLDVSRIASGKIVLRKDHASLGLVVSSAIESVRASIDAQGHRLSVAMPPEPIYVYGDVARLAQVIANLLNNAAKYTEKGGHITLTLVREGNEAVIRVRDTGIGISPDQVSRIFVMFAQLDQSLERGQGGLGVGLALAKTLVELHGGQIAVHSEGLGKGSEFIVRLPMLLTQQTVSERPAELLTPAPPNPRKILIADDNFDSARVLSKALQLDGHEVIVAYDGLAAVEKAESFNPDLAILDVGMPKLNGYDVARRLRNRFGKRITLIAITGWGQDEDKRLAREAGFDHHLTKPVDIPSIQALLQTVGSA